MYAHTKYCRKCKKIPEILCLNELISEIPLQRGCVQCPKPSPEDTNCVILIIIIRFVHYPDSNHIWCPQLSTSEGHLSSSCSPQSFVLSLLFPLHTDDRMSQHKDILKFTVSLLHGDESSHRPCTMRRVVSKTKVVVTDFPFLADYNRTDPNPDHTLTK